MSTVFAGLDWASRTHAVCVIDERGAVRKHWEVSHDAPGLRDLLRQLRALRALRIAIERPSGVLVDTLVEAGFEVVPIHPNVVKASRPRYRPPGFLGWHDGGTRRLRTQRWCRSCRQGALRSGSKGGGPAVQAWSGGHGAEQRPLAARSRADL